MAIGSGSDRLMSDINVTPFVDVMLVLLVIFMVTAPLLTQGIEVDLPQANAEPRWCEPCVRTVASDWIAGEGRSAVPSTMIRYGRRSRYWPMRANTAQGEIFGLYATRVRVTLS
mgnify:CR=1 FL=1